jgi:hypothetical protein
MPLTVNNPLLLLDLRFINSSSDINRIKDGDCRAIAMPS